MSDYFHERSHLLNLLPAGAAARKVVSGVTGLRRAQRGAVFTVAGHFETSSEPALVAIPTGCGKTAVKTMLPFVLGARRVLVVTPSTLLRRQLAAEFRTLTVMRECGVVPKDMSGPVVRTLEHLADDQFWAGLENCDVLVGTIYVMSPGRADVVAPPADLFDLIIIDEAHHSPARLYRALLDACPDVPTVLFTATPFRRDRLPLPVAPTFTYRLSQALADGVLSPIDFVPVDVPEWKTPAERDAALVAAARRALAEPAHVAAGSKILARTSSVRHAQELVGRYRDAGLEMGLIIARTTAAETHAILGKLAAGVLAGLISVGVLGEGFDCPSLKIGVYHRRHASLPATLQFLGRISRVLRGGPRACLIAFREEVNDETRELYTSDVAWAELVPALADAAVESEGRRRMYVQGFDVPSTQPLSPSALRPRKTMTVFRLREDTSIDLCNPVERLGRGKVVHHSVHANGRVAVIVTACIERPDWMVSSALDSVGFALYIVHLDKKMRLALVHGPRDRTVFDLVEALGEHRPRLVDPQCLDRLMIALKPIRYRQVGMKSIRAAGGILAEYRTLAGEDIGRAVLPAETVSYSASHVNAKVSGVIDADGPSAGDGAASDILGVSYRRARIFSPENVDLLAYSEWCDRAIDLMMTAGTSAPLGLPGIELRTPRPIAEFPENPYLAGLDPALLVSGVKVQDPHSGRWVELERFEVLVTRLSAHELGLTGRIDGVPCWLATLDREGIVSSAEDLLLDQEPGSLAGLLNDTPLSIFYPDGASTFGGLLSTGRPEGYADLAPPTLESIEPEFAAIVDITAEVKNPLPGKITVQECIIRRFSRDPEVEFVVVDDRKGEIADLVVFYRPSLSGMRRICLCHCKFSDSSKPGARVQDFHDLLGQVGRSVCWLDSGKLACRLISRLQTGSVVAYGAASDLDRLLAELGGGAPVMWRVAAAQLGLSIGSANSSRNIKTMLSSTLEWVQQHYAEFTVICSD